MKKDFRTCNCKNEIFLCDVASIGKTKNTFQPTKPENIHWFNCPKCRTTFIVYSDNVEGPTVDEFVEQQKGCTK